LEVWWRESLARMPLCSLGVARISSQPLHPLSPAHWPDWLLSLLSSCP
jgi:hypothetical protein